MPNTRYRSRHGRRAADVIQRYGRVVVAGVVLACTGVAGLLIAPSSPVNADVTTVSQDTYRTGWDQNEPALTPANVASSSFGQLYSTPVEGQV